jgi:aryl-alcohol dehydrogenase (NADP+)
MLPLCSQEGIGVIPWSPLARGFLAGNRRAADRGDTERAKSDVFAHRLYYRESDFRIVERVAALAQRRGVAPAQIALAWLLHQPGVTAPIVGATKMVQLEESIAAAEITLTVEERRELEELYEPHPVAW